MAERHAEEFERAREIELGEAVLLRGLLGLLLVPVERHVIGGQLAEVGFQGIDDVLRHLPDRNVGRLAGCGIPDLECPLHRHFPDAAQFESEADRLDIERHGLMVAHPDEDRRQGADEGNRAIAEHLVAIPRRRFSELARQHFADRVGVADGEGIEGVRILDARRHHEVEAENVVLATEATSERQDFAVELVVRLAVHQHEAGGVGQGVRQERQQRRRFARPGCPRHGRVLAAVVGGDPELPAFEIVAQIDRACRHAGAAADRRGIVPVPDARGLRQAQRQGHATAHDEAGVEERRRHDEIDERRLDEHRHGAPGQDDA